MIWANRTYFIHCLTILLGFSEVLDWTKMHLWDGGKKSWDKYIVHGICTSVCLYNMHFRLDETLLS
jgi:hypothetical protein